MNKMTKTDNSPHLSSHNFNCGGFQFDINVPNPGCVSAMHAIGKRAVCHIAEIDTYSILAPEYYPHHLRLLKEAGEYHKNLTDLVKTILGDPETDDKARLDAIEYLPLVPENDRAELEEIAGDLIKYILSYPVRDIHIEIFAVEYLSLVPENDRAGLIDSLLSNPLTIDYIKTRAIAQIAHVPESERAKLQHSVERALVEIFNNYLSFDEQLLAIKLIPCVPESERAEMYEIALGIIGAALDDDSEDYNTKRLALAQIPHAPESERTELIKATLMNLRVSDEIKLNSITLIPYVPENERAKLYDIALSVIEGMLDDDEVVERDKQLAIGQIAHFPQSQADYLINLARKKGYKLTTQSPLHDLAEDGVVKFTKSGSETFILPKDTELSVRIISSSSFFAWLEAYLSPKVWENAGFHYVPIEPIWDVSQVNDFEVAVTTSNLRGQNLMKSLPLYDSNIQSKIVEAKNKIMETLQRLKIVHGHLHDENFVLVPQTTTNDNGEIVGDPSKMPRIYVIDFDIANKQ